MLLLDSAWSSGAKIAADAIALAFAIADDHSLRANPVRALALADALHCAAIGLLNDETDPHEHETMATRVRELRLSPIEAFRPPAICTDFRPTVSLSA